MNVDNYLSRQNQTKTNFHLRALYRGLSVVMRSIDLVWLSAVKRFVCFDSFS
jgi:hypothetical protein